MAGNDAGTLGADGVDEPGDEVGEAFTDSGARFEEEGVPGFDGIGHRERHGTLLGSMIELKHGLKVATLLEDAFDKRHEITRHRGAAVVFDESDHSFTKEH